METYLVLLPEQQYNKGEIKQKNRENITNPVRRNVEETFSSFFWLQFPQQTKAEVRGTAPML